MGSNSDAARTNSAKLPEHWLESFYHAYTVFGLGRRAKNLLDGGGMTIAKKRSVELQPRNSEGEWVDMPGIHLPEDETEPRANIGGHDKEETEQIEIDALDQPQPTNTQEPEEEPEEEELPKFYMPQISPALKKEEVNVLDKEGNPIRKMDKARSLLKREVIVPALTPLQEFERMTPELVAEIRKAREAAGIEPLQISPDGVWHLNGADLRSFNDEARAEVESRLAEIKELVPSSAGSVEDMTRNVLDAFFAASKEEEEFGLEWYDEAGRQAAILARKYKVDPHIVAAILSATSPRTEWESNLAAVKVALESLLPEKSPQITEKFLATQMTENLDLEGNKLKPDDKRPTGKDYILHREEVRDSFKKWNPQRPDESKEAWEERISNEITSVLESRNPDGTELKIYQIRDQALRGALMDINNRVIATRDPNHRKGMGIQVPTYTADGYVQDNKRKSFAKILQGNLAGIDRLFGYDAIDPREKILEKGWSDLPTDPIGIHERIERTLGGHKTRSFYNNIIMRGRSGFATIDVHALRVALLGTPATRSGASVPGADELLDHKTYFVPKRPKKPPKGSPPEEFEQYEKEKAIYDEAYRIRQERNTAAAEERRIGVYAAVNEAFRRATEQINLQRAEQGEPPIDVAQVQAVAWVASRPNSVASEFMHMATRPRNPERTAERLFPDLDEQARGEALQRVSLARGFQRARISLKAGGFSDEQIERIIPDEQTYQRISAAKKTAADEFNVDAAGSTMKMNDERTATLAWLLQEYGDNYELIAERMLSIFPGPKKNRNTLTAAQVASMVSLMGDRYTNEEILSGVIDQELEAQLQKFNEQRRANGARARKKKPKAKHFEPAPDFTLEQIKRLIRNGYHL